MPDTSKENNSFVLFKICRASFGLKSTVTGQLAKNNTIKRVFSDAYNVCGLGHRSQGAEKLKIIMTGNKKLATVL